jgi:hypothetical protein
VAESRDRLLAAFFVDKWAVFAQKTLPVALAVTHKSRNFA